MGNYLGAIWRCRFFWMSLVKMDLRTRYRRSILGIGWSLLHPIAMTLIICLVFHEIMKIDVWHFCPYLLAGLACWNYIVASTTIGCQSLFQGEAYIRQYPAPLAIYPLRTTLGATIHFLMALVVVFSLMTYVRIKLGTAENDVNLAADRTEQLLTLRTGEVPAVKAAAAAPLSPEVERLRRDFSLLPLVTLVPTICLLFVFCWSLAILAGFSNVYFSDTQHLCEVGFQIFFYLTPIMYPKSVLENNGLSWVLYANPLTTMLDLIREPVVEGRFPSWQLYSLACGIVAVAGGAAALALARLQRRVIFYM
jgi:ABC-type polysaccharide/polyol phosphate export permease